ncbi:quinon protein alcohol dehydrogenase-like superfamily [Hypomontagnella monticulosa]|nr:quinon protein alcohol dehydrogenase-like superfamily [Hypomontagnella monticulosa]
MTDHDRRSDFHGQGVQNSGSGNVTVGRDLNIVVPQDDCLVDLFLTDPRLDKERIKRAKGGLLRDSYSWILGHDDFLRWRDDPECRLLWIKGDPGKGKTMLLCGIIEELDSGIGQVSSDPQLMSYFFCQATDPRLNNSVAVLRGLIYLLVNQRQSLIPHVQKQYKGKGKASFEDVNAWVALREILLDILRDPDLPQTMFFIDALDECETDLQPLLDLIVEFSVTFNVKWIVSSRNHLDIQERLDMTTQKVRLCLELNQGSISEAVHVYIHSEVDRLAKLKNYDDNLREDVRNYLVLNANDTFLWVSLVCQELENHKVRNHNAWRKLHAFPPGLDPLYARMMDQITDSDDAEVCKQILAVMLVAYRPLQLLELASLVESLQDSADDLEFLEDMVSLCGSFLNYRESTVSFIHQSANDYLLQNEASTIFPLGIENEHRDICLKSLELMDAKLRRNIYELDDAQLNRATLISPDPLEAVRYSCTYWIDHLVEGYDDYQAWDPDLRDDGIVFKFLRHHFLHWVEALMIIDDVARAIDGIPRLNRLLTANEEQSNEFLEDAYKFIQFHHAGIESFPLQVYTSLFFTPSKSIIRQIFRSENPRWLALEPTPEVQWRAEMYRPKSSEPDGFRNFPSISLSINGSRIALSSWEDRTTKILDASTGACLVTIVDQALYSRKIAISPDGSRLAGRSKSDRYLRIWDTTTGECTTTIETPEDGYGYFSEIVFAPDGNRLAASDTAGDLITIWSTTTGRCLITITSHGGPDMLINFSSDGSCISASSRDLEVWVWDSATGVQLASFVGHHNHVTPIILSPDGTQLASSSKDQEIKIWDIRKEVCLKTLVGHDGSVKSIGFSPNGGLLASYSKVDGAKVWDVATGKCLGTTRLHDHLIDSIAFSPDGSYLITNTQILPLSVVLDTNISLGPPWESPLENYRGSYLGWGWINYNGHNLLRVPVRNWSDCSAMIAHTAVPHKYTAAAVGINGEVWMSTFTFP